MAEGAYGKMGFARFYALVFGIAYLGVALLELLLDELSLGGVLILDRTTLQNIIHWVIGLAVLGSFFAGEAAARTVARIVGVVLTLLAVIGFLMPDTVGELLGFEGDLPMAYNIVHLVTGGAALFAGFAGSRRPVTA